jgi:hypothetical protein
VEAGTGKEAWAVWRDRLSGFRRSPSQLAARQSARLTFVGSLASSILLIKRLIFEDFRDLVKFSKTSEFLDLHFQVNHCFELRPSMLQASFSFRNLVPTNFAISSTSDSRMTLALGFETVDFIGLLYNPLP